MDLALIFSAFLLGLAGTPHCAAMCGAPCAAVVGSGGPQATARSLSFHLARMAGYSAVGALAAAGVGIVSMAGAAAPLVRPLWVMLHAAALGLGLWLLITGRQPAWMTQLGSRQRQPAAVTANGWQVMQTPWTAAAAGSVWVAWPCGLLQSALVVAALANSPQAGGAVMAAFAMASAAGLQAAPWLASRLRSSGTASITWAIRLAGAALAAGSAFALGHDIWGRVLDYCLS
jgi:sulfite exporter TauE/SafE